MIIKKLKGFGFTLNEISGLLAMIEENVASCNQVNQTMEVKVKAINDKIAELQQIKNILLNGVELCLNGCQPADDRNCTLLIP